MTLRIGGLASGMDIETMVSDLMKAQRTKLDAIVQKKQYTEWQRDDYRAANKSLFDFRNLASDSMMRQSTYIQKTATSSAPDEIAVRNINSVSNFSGTVNVQQLAEKATLRSTDVIGPSATDISTKNLDQLGVSGLQTIKIRALKEDGTLQSDSEATTITFDPTTKKLQDVLSEINQKSNVSAFYDSYTGKIQMSAKYSGSNTTSTGADTGKEIVLDFSGAAAFQSLTKLSNDNLSAIGQGTMTSTAGIAGMTIGSPASSKTLADLGIASQTLTIKSLQNGTLSAGKDIVLTYTMTLDQALTAITNDATAGVTASYDSATGKITLLAKNAGDNVNGNEIELSSDKTGTDGFLTVTNLATNNANQKTVSTTSGSEGKNAIFTLDGLTTQRASNTFTVNGFELTLKKASNTNVTFTSATDTDKIIESVSKFVDEYNKIIDNLNTKIREKRNRDYPPLTDTQKEKMKDTDIERWETLAKKGTLQNDSILSSALNKMRANLTDPVKIDSKEWQLKDIGISPAGSYLENGKLVIDEAKLREAISNNPNQVYQMFAADGATSAEKGFARRLVSTIDDARKQVITKAGSESSVNNSFAIGRTLNNYNSQISSFENRLKVIENRYWKQFTAMETAINKSNAQSTQLSNYLK